jgi:hypothetical protein
MPPLLSQVLSLSLLGFLLEFMLAVAPCAEPENVSFFMEITKQQNLNLFFGHHLLSLLFFGTEGCPPFILRQLMCQQTYTATYQ